MGGGHNLMNSDPTIPVDPAASTPPSSGVEKLTSWRGEAFNQTKVMPIRSSSYFMVHVDGVPYAGFVDEEHAFKAVDLWRKYWPAAQTRILVLKVAGKTQVT